MGIYHCLLEIATAVALVQSLRDEGKSYREIAEMTEMSAATVYRILQKVS